MKYVKDGILYDTKTSVKIGGARLQTQLEDVGNVYQTLYRSKNERYYLLITAGGRFFSRPIGVEVLSNAEAFRYAVAHLSADTVKKHFPDMLSEG